MLLPDQVILKKLIDVYNIITIVGNLLEQL